MKIDEDYRRAEAQIRGLPAGRRRRVRAAIRLRREIARLERELLRPLQAKLARLEEPLHLVETTLAMRHALMRDLLEEEETRLRFSRKNRRSGE